MCDYSKYLVGDYKCSCGKIHNVTTKKILVERGAIYKIPFLLDELGLSKDIFIVCDENTFEAAGKTVIKALRDMGIDSRHYVFKENDIHHPDEKAIGSIMMAMEPEPGLIMAVGTGTLNDLCKFCATRMKIPYCVVGTAPSMDGFASNVIPITKDGMKISYHGVTPEFILGDLSVLAKSPQKLMAAGFGDIIGKVPARLDWMFGHLAFGENMCEEIEDLVNNAVAKCLEHAPDLVHRSDDAVKGVMDALVLSGIAMQMNGDSRPASGAEHHISHFLEMRDGDNMREGAYHGAKVGMATFITMRLYEKFFEADPPPQGVVMEKMELKAKIRKAFGDVADDVILEKGFWYYEKEEWQKIKSKIIEHWDVFKANVEGFAPLREETMKITRELNGVVKPQDLGYTREDMYDAIMFARMVRKRPTILEVLANWGFLEKYAEEVLDELFE
jgi:glycerol-1-phosphate dehydrogenase [NAD(P)+]